MQHYPLYETEQSKNFAELLENCIEYYGELPIFVEKDGAGGLTEYSASEFRDMAVAFGAALLSRGLLAGGKVAVLGETSVRWVATYFAVVCGGGVIVPVDKELPEDEMANVLNESGAGALVFSASLKEVAEAVRGRLNGGCELICISDEPGYSSFDELAREGRQNGLDKYLSVETDENALSSLLFTSGTTGKSKGVMLSQRNILRAAQGGNQLFIVGKRLMSVLPIHHSYEFTHGIIQPITNGATICINDSPRYFLQNIQLFQPETIFLVPAYVEMIYKKIWATAKEAGTEQQLRALIEKSRSELAQGQDNRAVYFKSIRDSLGGNLSRIPTGGAPLAAFYSQAFDDLGIQLLQGYGITECSPLVSVNRNGFNKHGSVGLPIGCCEVRVMDKDEEGDGDIWVRGDNVMLGYYKNPQATAEVMDGEWFNTGDVGYVDEDGFLYITGRKKNLIVLSNGKNVYPEEIEGYLCRIPYIKEVVVYAIMEDGMETKLHAEIYVDEAGRQGRDDAQLKADLKSDMEQVNRSLPGYKQVHDFALRDNEFEKTTKRSIKRFTIKK